MSTLDHWFSPFSRKVAHITGRATAFVASCVFVSIWLLSGPFFDYSENWQLIINTATTILTFLMVFVIQNSTERETLSIQLKLDELISSDTIAHNELLIMEDLEEEELIELKHKFEKLAKEAHEALEKR